MKCRTHLLSLAASLLMFSTPALPSTASNTLWFAGSSLVALPLFAVGASTGKERRTDYVKPLLASGVSGSLLYWLSQNKLSNTANSLPLSLAIALSLHESSERLTRYHSNFIGSKTALAGSAILTGGGLLTAQKLFTQKKYGMAFPAALLTTLSGANFLRALNQFSLEDENCNHPFEEPLLF